MGNINDAIRAQAGKGRVRSVVKLSLERQALNDRLRQAARGGTVVREITEKPEAQAADAPGAGNAGAGTGTPIAGPPPGMNDVIRGAMELRRMLLL